MYIIQRYNGKYWLGDPDRDDFGHYSNLKRATEQFNYWTKQQPTSAWRIILRTVSETVLDQSEPE